MDAVQAGAGSFYARMADSNLRSAYHTFEQVGTSIEQNARFSQGRYTDGDVATASDAGSLVELLSQMHQGVAELTTGVDALGTAAIPGSDGLRAQLAQSVADTAKAAIQLESIVYGSNPVEMQPLIRSSLVDETGAYRADQTLHADAETAQGILQAVEGARHAAATAQLHAGEGFVKIHDHFGGIPDSATLAS